MTMSSQNDDQPTSSVHVEPKGEVERPVEPPCADEPLAARIEALLLSTDRPLAEARLADVLGLDEKTATQAVRAAIDELNAHYEQTGRSFRAERLAGGWQLLTLPEFGPLMTRLHRERQQSRLSPAANCALPSSALTSSCDGFCSRDTVSMRTASPAWPASRRLRAMPMVASISPGLRARKFR